MPPNQVKCLAALFRALKVELTSITMSVPGCRWILQSIEGLISWIHFKPRSLVVRKGKLSFSLEGVQIPSVSVKSLGKIFDCTLRDTTALQATSNRLGTWMITVDKSGLPGKFKAWFYQYGILPRLLWPLLVYEVPLSSVEGFERKESHFL